jgi:hypothetical protein
MNVGTVNWQFNACPRFVLTWSNVKHRWRATELAIVICIAGKAEEATLRASPPVRTDIFSNLISVDRSHIELVNAAEESVVTAKFLPCNARCRNAGRLTVGKTVGLYTDLDTSCLRDICPVGYKPPYAATASRTFGG